MEGTRVGRVFGIELRVHWSAFVVLVLFVVSLGAELLPDRVAGASERDYWLTAVASGVAFVGGLVVHELAHLWMARRHGLRVESVTLWVLGGVSEIHRDADTPMDTMKIAAAGPCVSALLGAVALLMTGPTSGLLAVALGWIGVANILLFAFNLLPALPLDGGRIYEAWCWQRTGSYETSVQRAAAVGHFFGKLVIWIGVLEIVFGSLLAGAWLLAVGGFIREASIAEAVGARVRSRLAHIRVGDVMTTTPETVLGSWTLQDFFDHLFLSGRHAAYPVIGHQGTPTGLMTIDRLRSVHSADWPRTLLADAALPLSKVPVVQPSVSVEDLAEMLADRDASRALVMDHSGRLEGIIAPSDMARLVTLAGLGDTATAFADTPSSSSDHIDLAGQTRNNMNGDTDMTHQDPTTFTVTVWRHNCVMHVQQAADRAEADALAAKYEAQPGTDVVIDERHAAHDLTTLTREMVEDRQ